MLEVKLREEVVAGRVSRAGVVTKHDLDKGLKWVKNFDRVWQIHCRQRRANWGGGMGSLSSLRTSIEQSWGRLGKGKGDRRYGQSVCSKAFTQSDIETYLGFWAEGWWELTFWKWLLWIVGCGSTLRRSGGSRKNSYSRVGMMRGNWSRSRHVLREELAGFLMLWVGPWRK